MSDVIHYSGTFKTIQEIADWINHYRGGEVLPDLYDASTPRHPGTLLAYKYNDCCSDEDGNMYRCIVQSIYADAQNPPEFDPSQWEAFGNIYDMIDMRPGMKVNYSGEIFNNYIDNTASGNNSHAEGNVTSASGSYSHAEGGFNEASGAGSHAEGGGASISEKNTASGESSHAEGRRNTASGIASHASGINSQSVGKYSQAMGEGTLTMTQGEAAVGKYNQSYGDGSSYTTYTENRSYRYSAIVKYNNDGNVYQANQDIAKPAGPFDSSKWDIIGTYSVNPLLFSVGNGTSDGNRSNAFEVHVNGDCYANGQLIVPGGGGGVDKVHTDTTANWNAQTTLIGQAGHIYIYSDYDTSNGHNVPAMKVGDGLSYLIDAPFADASSYHIKDTSVHVSSADRTAWNGKVTCYIDSQNAERIIFE